MDALSQVLRSFRLRGSIYCSWKLGRPWGISFAAADHSPFHFIQSGACTLIRKDGEQVDLQAGDVVALFDGAEHRLCDSPHSRAEPLERILARLPKGAAPVRYGGSGPGCELICGKFAVDERETGSASLRHLPPLVHIPRRDSARVSSFTTTLELLASEARRRESGWERAASLLTEMLLIEVVRTVLSDAAASASSGWVEGLRDRQIASALAAIHGEPERPWSVESLAAVAGLSRSMFAERFAKRLGRTPMSYLSEWRLKLAARLLRETELSVSEIFQKLGFASAASFDRAFKRAHRLSPSAYRRRLKPANERAAAQLAI